MSQTATVAAEMWERDDLDQPAIGDMPADPRLTMGADPSDISTRTEDGGLSRSTRAADLSEEEAPAGSTTLLGWGNFAQADWRPFLRYPLPVQVSAVGGQWADALLPVEVPICA